MTILLSFLIIFFMLRHKSIFLKVLKKKIKALNKKHNYLNTTYLNILVYLLFKFKVNKFYFSNEAITLTNHNYELSLKIFLNIYSEAM